MFRSQDCDREVLRGSDLVCFSHTIVDQELRVDTD